MPATFLHPFQVLDFFSSRPSRLSPIDLTTPGCEQCHNRPPALVLSSCNVLLFILGSYIIALGNRAGLIRRPTPLQRHHVPPEQGQPLGTIGRALLRISTTTIAGCGDVLRHQPISEADIIPEFLLRQLRAVKAARYSAGHAPFLVALWRRFLSCPPGISFQLASYPRSTCIFARLTVRLDLRTHALWPGHFKYGMCRTIQNLAKSGIR